LKKNIIFLFKGVKYMNVNKKILKKIIEYNLDPCIENFLKDILFYELQHCEEAKPFYNERYDEITNKYMKKYKVEEK